LPPEWNFQTIITIFIYGVPGACVVLGMLSIMMGDVLKPFGITGLSSDGWIFLILGIVIYVIELILYYGTR
jgi:hypothetical protein